jgi:hypothetical protein
MGFQLLTDVLTLGLSLMLRLRTLMGRIGKGHTMRHLLHALKVLAAEVSFFLPPLSSPSLPKVVQYYGKTFVISLFGTFSKLENKISNVS